MMKCGKNEEKNVKKYKFYPTNLDKEEGKVL